MVLNPISILNPHQTRQSSSSGHSWPSVPLKPFLPMASRKELWSSPSPEVPNTEVGLHSSTRNHGDLIHPTVLNISSALTTKCIMTSAQPPFVPPGPRPELPNPALSGLTDLTGFTWPKGVSATSPQTCSPQGSPSQFTHSSRCSGQNLGVTFIAPCRHPSWGHTPSL